MDTKDSAKTVVCYGDSNTWGRIPHGEQYPRSKRWPYILQHLLGADYEVISEGLGGRTFVASEPAKPHLTGITHLQSILKTRGPIDLMIVMLGTNDMKKVFNLSASDIAEHLEQTIQLIQKEVSNILVICPPEIVVPETNDLEPNFQRSIGVSKQLPPLYKTVAEKYGCMFLNAQDYISSSTIDGFHLDAEAHQKLAEAINGMLA